MIIKQYTKLIKHFGNICKRHNLNLNYFSRKLTIYKMTSYKYPDVRRDLSIVDDLHGAKVTI